MTKLIILKKKIYHSVFSLKTTECHSLQSEFDTLASTLKQLTNQKEVAQKRLDDLDTQVCLVL
jgi:peptidoglycan hydrolase CwlO-like protein